MGNNTCSLLEGTPVPENIERTKKLDDNFFDTLSHMKRNSDIKFDQSLE